MFPTIVPLFQYNLEYQTLIKLNPQVGKSKCFQISHHQFHVPVKVNKLLNIFKKNRICGFVVFLKLGQVNLTKFSYPVINS